MKFKEAREGEYRIYVGAMDAPHGTGYIAAVVVHRGEGPQRHQVFRDDSLACGYRWPSPDEALQYAMTRALKLVRSGSPRLAC